LTKWEKPYAFDTLAAAYAEAGNFDLAIKWQQNAIALESEEVVARDKYKDRLALYRKGKPYREEAKGKGLK
jgi:hypothetical protein